MDRKLALFFFIGLTGAIFFASVLAAEDYGSTARGMFAMMPTSIFENTTADLSENAKQELLHTGQSDFWEIVGETEDVMVFAEKPFTDRYVALRIFRNNKDGSVEAAIGTLGEPVCGVEIWRLDVWGRLSPVETPPEPDINEFFSTPGKRGRVNRYSVMICLGEGGLKAKPVAWNGREMVEPVTDWEINFQWNGNSFVKNIRSAKK